jgi:YidC/Oxa1 family membrane protein insertase
MNFLTIAWNTLIYEPIFNLLIFFYQISFTNLGLAIIGITFFIKIVTHPITKSSMELAKKQQLLKPQIDKLKEQYKDKQVFAQKQMELMRQNGINPALGCLPQLITIFFVFGPLYAAFKDILDHKDTIVNRVNELTYNWDFLKFKEGQILNADFLGMNLAIPNYYLPILAAAAQFYLSKIMKPAVDKAEKVAKNTPDKQDDIMYNVQEQMLYTMPIVTFIIGISLPAGLTLYMLLSTLIAAVQYLIINRGYGSNSAVKN